MCILLGPSRALIDEVNEGLGCQSTLGMWDVGVVTGRRGSDNTLVLAKVAHNEHFAWP